MEISECANCVWGHHVYQSIWTTTEGKNLPCAREEGSNHDLYTIAALQRKDRFILPMFRLEYSDLLQDLLCPEEGQSILTETSARQTCLSHAGIREPNLSHDCASGEALASLQGNATVGHVLHQWRSPRFIARECHRWARTEEDIRGMLTLPSALLCRPSSRRAGSLLHTQVQRWAHKCNEADEVTDFCQASGNGPTSQGWKTTKDEEHTKDEQQPGKEEQEPRKGEELQQLGNAKEEQDCVGEEPI